MMENPVRPPSTVLKTHRYLRLSLVFVVFAILASVLIQTAVVSWRPLEFGWNMLPSISHYFYTPVRTVFVGALIAASLALLSLSGRSRAVTLLDISALFAPLIALVPTGIAPSQRTPEQICPESGDCVPDEYLDGARAGIAVYAVVVFTTIIVMALVRRHDRLRRERSTRPALSPEERAEETLLREDAARSRRSAAIVSWVAAVTAVVMLVLAFAPGLSDGFPFNFWPFPSSIHFAATLLFFGAFAAVPLLHAREDESDEQTAPAPWQRTLYRWVSRCMAGDLVVLIVAFAIRDHLNGFPLVLIGEAFALSLFAVFWWVQTLQRWDDEYAPYLVDPDAPPPGPAGESVTDGSSRGTGSARA